MERWIDRLLMGCGGAAGLLLGTGRVAEGIATAAVAVPLAWLLRTRALPASADR